MSARNDLIESLGLPGRDPRPGWAVAALDQQRAEFTFQRADGLADSGLSDLVDLRGLGEALGFSQVTEHL